MTKEELHRVIAVNSGGLIGAERIRIAVDAYTQALQQTELPLNLAIYKKAQEMDYEQFCIWLNQKRKQIADRS
jgi:hypothetical protein